MIYLCRHGETVFNREGRFQGHAESDLTPHGERQVRAMAGLLHDLIVRDPPAPWRIVASPLRRTRASAAIIAERLGFEIEIEPRLMEVGVGAWEGRLRKDIERDNPLVATRSDWVFHAPGGETYDDVFARMNGWLCEQAAERERRLIVVSHGVAGRLLRAAYAGLAPDAALAQDAPQDAIYRLSGGQLDRLSCA